LIKYVLYISITLLLLSTVFLIVSVNITRVDVVGKMYTYQDIDITHSFYVYLYGNDTLKLRINLDQYDISKSLLINITHLSSNTMYTTLIPLVGSNIPLVTFTADKPGLYKVTILLQGVEHQYRLKAVIEGIVGEREGYKTYYSGLSMLFGLFGLASLTTYFILIPKVKRRFS